MALAGVTLAASVGAGDSLEGRVIGVGAGDSLVSVSLQASVCPYSGKLAPPVRHNQCLGILLATPVRHDNDKLTAVSLAASAGAGGFFFRA